MMLREILRISSHRLNNLNDFVGIFFIIVAWILLSEMEQNGDWKKKKKKKDRNGTIHQNDQRPLNANGTTKDR